MRVTLNPQYTLTKYANEKYCAVSREGKRIPLKTGEVLCLYAAPDTEYSKSNPFYKSLSAKGLLCEGNKDPSYREKPYVYREAAQISITSRCNCRCLHCYAADENGHADGEFSFGQICRILDECQSVGIVRTELTGGEPLMRSDLLKIIREINVRGMSLRAIHTNAVLIDEKFLSGLREEGFSPKFYVSFDGLGTHDWQRGVTGCEKAVLSRLDLLHREGFTYRCNINVNRRTLPRLNETVRYLALEKNADIYLIWTAPTPRWRSAAPEESLSFEEYFEHALEIIRISRLEKWKNKVKALFVPYIPDEQLMEKVIHIWHRADEPCLSAKNMDYCGKSAEMIYIAHDGRVLPCSVYEEQSLKEGFMTGDDLNVLIRPLAEILTDSSYFEPFRVTLGDIAATEEKCRTCRWLAVCKGGCRLLSSLRGIDTASDASCVFYRGGYAQKLEEIILGG